MLEVARLKKLQFVQHLTATGCTVVPALSELMAASQDDGKRRIFASYRVETPERFVTKLGRTDK